MDDNKVKLTSSLSFKLIGTIFIVILLVEIFIYLPSLANFRTSWLNDRLSVGGVAARVLDVVPDVIDLPSDLKDSLLDSAKAIALVYRGEGQSQLIEHSKITMPSSVVTADMRNTNSVNLITSALETLFFGSDRILRIVGFVQASDKEMLIEVLISEAPLRKSMLDFSKNIAILSLIIAFFTSFVIYIFINRALIKPIRAMIDNMIAFRQAPENATLIIKPSNNRDEIGIAKKELNALESDLFAQLGKRRHLADLGLAVAKINHDLRNMLTSVQLLSDQVASLDDPEAQRLAPRLVHSLDKAISFAQSVLEHGRQSSTVPKPEPVDLRALVDEAALDASVSNHPNIIFDNQVPDAIILNLDPDQIARVIVNLLKNSREALEGAGTRTKKPKIVVQFENRDKDGLAIIVSDNGPGLPPRAKENLFVPFEGSARSGGTGLGLSIAREICEAHGGTIDYVDKDKGARFDICLPNSIILD